MAEYIDREAAIKAINDSDPNGIRRTFGFKVEQIEEALRAVPAVDVEKISDGYHTFADLYEQRLILSAALAKNNPHAWKSKRHEDGSEPFGGGWFIMGFDTDEGCYTYHYELKDWDLFQCKELDKGKPWDGHTSKDVRRLLSIPAAVSVPQCISVKDRLPENKTRNIVLRYDHVTKTHFVDILWFCGNGWFCNPLGSGAEDKSISCWMPLPEPPKGENDG